MEIAAKYVRSAYYVHVYVCLYCNASAGFSLLTWCQVAKVPVGQLLCYV